MAETLRQRIEQMRDMTQVKAAGCREVAANDEADMLDELADVLTAALALPDGPEPPATSDVLDYFRRERGPEVLGPEPLSAEESRRVADVLSIAVPCGSARLRRLEAGIVAKCRAHAEAQR